MLTQETLCVFVPGKFVYGKKGASAAGLLTVLAAMLGVNIAVGQSHTASQGGEQLSLRAGRLIASWQQSPSGVVLEKIELADGGPVLVGRAPLFVLTLRNLSTGENRTLSSQQGWQQVAFWAEEGAVEIRFGQPAAPFPPTFGALVRVEALAEQSAFSWHIKVPPAGGDFSLWEVRFPILPICELTADAVLVYPKAPGVAEAGVWQRAFEFGGRYPSGWVTMQFGACYVPDGSGGLYMGVHDPWGSTKELRWRSDPATKVVTFSVDYPVPNMGRPEAEFSLPGRVVTQFFEGDWFDAAQIYRRWVEEEAKWFPTLGPEGREDTPLWMRELPLWILGGGAPEECVPGVLRFRQAMGVPCGFHWYNWHQIPFDNDYPHYFPTKPGFAEGVRQLQEGGVHVMPYINGRLWDSRDKGLEDFQFTSVALPAATKNHQGEPFLETYGSKESDGSPVRLAVMCPTTSVWQNKVGELVAELFGRCGTHAVYIDQVAAAAPTLCADPSHGHPLGGGRWWNEGYWQLLEKIRASKPADRMITTECNAEPFVRWFDGYLTWHWQYDRQVPLFPAVYGGSVQMFGRWFGNSGSGRLQAQDERRNRDLSVRMRLAQQLVFGEQLGWIHTTVLEEEQNAAFLKQLAQLRWELRRYFYAGRMGRPPRLLSSVPTVTADWKWGGKSVVTTEAILVGQWVLPGDKRAILLAVNVAEDPLSLTMSAPVGDPWFRLGAGKIVRTWPEKVPLGSIEGGTWRVDCTVPGLGAYIWEVGPSED
ncbi:MAG: DUF6259 domain-containing protein [Thermoguttaceae bacterium]|nr:DUF6259 domain-containing protein [Thermoguttaceae bacterium]MDW8077861.1 DUF6259 domain-containing protein [Thermoguttaceae bacterium]